MVNGWKVKKSSETVPIYLKIAIILSRIINLSVNNRNSEYYFTKIFFQYIVYVKQEKDRTETLPGQKFSRV